MPAASSVPNVMVQDYKAVFRNFKMGKIEVVDIQPRQNAKDEAFCDVIDRAAGIFIRGRPTQSCLFAGRHPPAAGHERAVYV